MLNLSFDQIKQKRERGRGIKMIIFDVAIKPRGRYRERGTEEKERERDLLVIIKSLCT